MLTQCVSQSIFRG